MAWINSDVNLSVVNMYNQSNVSMENVALNETYKGKAIFTSRIIFISFGITFGIVILLCNITVVISSGLILKKGQQPKSTYLLLGNVSLADALFGLALILRFSLERLMIVDDTYCIFQIGITMCPSMVSILSVGLIAVDRYIYILHGLYYHRWFTTARIRFGILCTWVIGITLTFLPITGWINKELKRSRCMYIYLYPRELLLLNSLVVIIIIVLVGILYSIILVKAIKHIKKIKSRINSVDSKNSKVPEIKMKTRNDNLKKSAQAEKSYTIKITKVNKSASFNGSLNSNFNHSKELIKLSYKSKSVDDIYVNQLAHNTGLTFSKNNDVSNDFESEFSIQSINSVESYQMTSTINIVTTENKNTRNMKCRKTKTIPKVKKEPNKWRAVIVVMLTFGCFTFTCLPFYIKVIVVVFCKDKLDHPLCIITMKSAFGSAITILSFLNNILNPLIYAWWHKGFQRSIRTYFRKYLQRYFR